VHLALHHNTIGMFDPTYHHINEGAFISTNCKAMYGDIKEAVPINAPTPLGKDIDLRLYVDYDHAVEKFIQRSLTGFVIYLNMAPIVWFFKHQPRLESSVFGAEFVAMKNGIETIHGICYKL
jgi:hypothetical protein